MINKSLFLTVALLLSSVAFAKTYDISFDRMMTVGNTQIAPGAYRLEIDGTNATFTNAKTKKSTTVPAKVQNVDKKIESTAVSSSTENGTGRIKSIDLEGTKTRLEFGQ